MFGAAQDRGFCDIIYYIKFYIGFNIMTALSIHLPAQLAQASQQAAEHLGISRTEFIRQAIIHELENLQNRLELEAMANSFSAMKKHDDYLKEVDKLDTLLSIKLPKEKEEWWKKK